MLLHAFQIGRLLFADGAGVLGLRGKLGSGHHAAVILLCDARLRKQGLGEKNAHVHDQPFHPAYLQDLHRHRPSK